MTVDGAPAEPGSGGAETAFLAGGGETGSLTRAHDWAGSPLGPPAAWPQPLKTLVEVMLAADQPMFVAWGPERSLLYNNGYAPMLADRHPAALGRPFLDVWAEAHGDLAPLIERVFAGEPVHMDDIELHLDRPGRPSEAHFAFGYTPVRDEAGRITGLFCACHETTRAVVAERHREALLTLDERLQDVSDTAGIAFAASQLLGQTLKASRAGFGAFDPAAATLDIERDWHAAGSNSIAGRHSLDHHGTHGDDVRRGAPVVIADVDTDSRTAARAAALAAIGVRALLDVPVVEGGRAVALMFVHSATPRAWTEPEIAFVRELAERTRAAIARRAAEQELRASEAELRFALKAGRLGAWRLDLVSGAFTASETCRNNFGRPVDAPFTYAQLQDAIHPDDRQRMAAEVARCVATREDYDIEYRIVTPAGETRWVQVRAKPSHAPDGTPLTMAGVSLDITDRKHAEAALRTSEARLRELNETLERGIAARTAELDRLWTLSEDLLARADYTGMMSAISPAWSRVLGFSAAELLARPYVDFLHPDDAGTTVAALDRMSETHAPTRFENRILCNDGNYKFIEWTVAPEPDGINFIAVGRDVTADRQRQAELEQAQEALRQSQKLESMGQLTGGVAHDLNNLLSPIMGSLDLLHRRGLGGEREQRMIDGALQSADRAKVLVQRLLAFARRQPLQPVSVDVGALVGGMAELIDSTSGPRVRVDLDVAPDLPLARADANQLELAILNLAVNARDAMPDGGRLTIATKAEAIGTGHPIKLPAGDYVRLSVADTGIGMDEATLARAVEPFFSTKGVGQGTGLGLSMAHGLASQLGGALALSSRPGAGTVVDFWLPVSRDPAKPQAPAPNEAAAVAGTVLLIDDEALVRASTAEMLDDLGYAVVEAASAEAALKLLADGLHPDIVLTDHLMSGMSGTELARGLRGARPDLPVLIISGYAEAEGIPPDMKRLTKPFLRADLAIAVADLATEPGE